MSVCLMCKERYMCDQLLYECPRGDSKPDGSHDELTSKQKAEWEELCHATKN